MTVVREPRKCVRCDHTAVPGSDLCWPCSHHVAWEASCGLTQLGAYLGRQAEFESWCHEHGHTA